MSEICVPIPPLASTAQDHQLDQRDDRGSVVFFEAPWHRTRIRRKTVPTWDSMENLNSRAFNPEEVAILSSAFHEACQFLGKDGMIGAARRQEIARVIMAHARRGPLDPHRLALKAIVHVG